MAKRKGKYDPEADKRWADKNREHRRYLSARGAARSFIRTKAERDDLYELREMIDEKLAEMLVEEKETE